MKIFGYELTLSKKAAVPNPASPLPWGYGRGGWWPLIHEPFTGAWQKNMEIRAEALVTYSAVYACVTLIASDIGKIQINLVEQRKDGIWEVTTSPAFSPVLRKPNRYQTRIKFIEQWMISKLIHGNMYALKGRDERRVVTELYILDPTRTKPLVAPDGDVFYQLAADNLTGIEESVIVPASEIIHDTMVALFHPLCGTSPLTACGLAALQGLNIQKNSNKFFEAGSQPSGILSAPGAISDEVAARLKDRWEQNYIGMQGLEKIAVLGDGLKFESMGVNAVDSQLIEQLKWTAETVCSCYHVPPYMIGIGEMPSYNNIEALNQQYYQQALQSQIESIELALDEGLGLVNVPDRTLGVEFALDDLLRMDTATKVKTAAEGLKGIFTPNEARKKFDLPPKPGGDAVYLQQQNYSIEALNERDQSDDPFATSKPAPAAAEKPEEPDLEDDAQAQLINWQLKQQMNSVGFRLIEGGLNESS